MITFCTRIFCTKCFVANFICLYYSFLLEKYQNIKNSSDLPSASDYSDLDTPAGSPGKVPTLS